MWKHTDGVFEGELELILLLNFHLRLFFAFLVLYVQNSELWKYWLFVSFCANKGF